MISSEIDFNSSEICIKNSDLCFAEISLKTLNASCASFVAFCISESLASKKVVLFSIFNKGLNVLKLTVESEDKSAPI